MKIIPILLALGLAMSSLAAPAAVRATEPAEDGGGISVSAAPAFDGVLRQNANLTIGGTVTNTTSRSTGASVATVYLGSATTSRRTLNRWLDLEQDAGSLGTAIGSVSVGEIAPGQIRSFTITVPSAQLGLDSQPFASYPIAVRLTVGTDELGLARTAVVWAPTQGTPSLGLTVLMPIITPPSATGILTAAELTEYTAANGVLTRQLDAALGHNTVAIGLDPMILASIRLLGTSAPATALDWLTRLSFASNDIFALSYADHDIALVSQAGVGNGLAPISFTIDPSLFPATTGPSESPGPAPASISEPTLPTQSSLLAWPYTLNGIAWPADNTVAESDLDTFATAGSTRTILASSQLNPAPSKTPNASVSDHDVVVSDAALSASLRAAATALSDSDWSHAIAALSSELATASAGENGATLLATLGRDGSVNGPRLSDTLTAIARLPWITSTPLTDALSVPGASAKLVDSPESTTRVDSFTTMLSSTTGPSEKRIAAFSSILTDPTQLTGPRRLALLSALSTSLYDDQTGWNNAVSEYLLENTTILSSVRIQDSSTITLLQEKGNLPIAVMNELDFPVTVYVTVQPDRAILRVTETRVELTIEPRSQAKASVPVESIANGEVRTTVSLTSGSNVRIDSPTVVDLNVQAGWETAATFILAGIVVLLFGVGIWRTVLRRRKLRADPESSDS